MLELRKKTALATLLLLCGILLYSRSIFYPFVYDDLWRVAQNKSIRSLEKPLKFFTDRTTQSSIPALHLDSYRPLVTLSFAFDYSLFQLNPAGYRLENIVIHGMNGVLIFFFSVSVLSFSLPAAFFSAFLFLSHPVQTESVVWIAERTNVLGLLFFLVSVHCWALFRKRGRLRFATGSHLFLVLSLLTREVALLLASGFLA